MNKKIYSNIIDDLIKIKKEIIVIPDLIMNKEGIACGDKLVISGQIDNDNLKFNFFIEEACDLSKAVCSYLQQNFNNKKIKVIKKKILQLNKKIQYNHRYIFNLFELDYEKFSERIECLLSPIKLFCDFIDNIESNIETFSEKPNTFERMECDACTGTCRINWKNEKRTKNNHHNGKIYSTDYLKKWLPYGKVTLTEDEINNLPKVLKSMTKEDYQFLSDHTMNSFVLSNIIKYCPNEINKNWKATSYLIQKNEITTNYFKEIKNYISKNSLSIYSVKGFVTQKYYEDPALRIHSDFDLIAETEEDAFKLMYYLLNDGFTIRPNLFSIKEMYDKRKNSERISGHFHLQKIIDDMYNFEIDLTFPGFPINRVELFYPKIECNSISIESQIVVTLLHLFKHSNIYMKDINDLYYMLHENIDFKYLNALIKNHNLFKFFELAVTYIYNNYLVDKKTFDKIISFFNINLNVINDFVDWPYNLDSHLKIKQLDFYTRTKTKEEAERIYLFPILIFKDFINIENKIKKINKDYKITKINSCVYKIKKENYIFYFTNIGIFIENYIDTSKLHRINYLNILEKFLSEIDNPNLFPISYATEHFYVRVI